MSGPPSSVMTMGTFDLLHPGHLELLIRCKQLAIFGGRLTVAVNSDEFVERFKQRRPVMSTRERVAMVRALQVVDTVVVNEGTDQAALIENAKPQLLVVGGDWAGRDYMGQLGISHDWLAERDIVLLYMVHGKSDEISTTKLRARMAGEHGLEATR
jgi:glycerol-3-phosphate cytidylyltransferase